MTPFHPKTRGHIVATAPLAIFVVACGGDGGNTVVGPPEPIPTYTVTLEAAPANLGALVIAFDGKERPLSVAFSGTPRTAIRQGDASRTTWRAAVVGAISVGRLGTIAREAPGGPEPTATVVEAAAGAAGGYAALPASAIRISIRRAN
jgi:hypothetical protein